MTIYQIHVQGQTDCLEDKFKCASKKVYTQKPNEKDIKEFVEICSHGSLFNLDTNKEYKTCIVELELIDNK